jgi:ADP-ribosyl-[dinitrogen reductase] hydrolase
VLDTLETALWAVYGSGSFEEALIRAVNLGRNGDTVGAVTGQLAGALYGASAIQERWLQRLAWREHFIATADRLLTAKPESVSWRA